MTSKQKSIITLLIIVGGIIYFFFKHLATMLAITASPIGLIVALIVIVMVLWAVYKLLRRIFS